MAHLIETTDRVHSNKGHEWHGKAIFKQGADGVPVELTREELKDIMFPLVSCMGMSGVGPDGHPIHFPEYQGVVADLRGRGNGAGFVPLAIHGDTYGMIDNGMIWDGLKEGLQGIPHAITTAGTLDGCKRFFVSVELLDAPGFTVRRDTFKAYVNFISSHDGSLALRGYDSSVRIVCNNTLNFSLGAGAKGKLNAVVKHTGNAHVHIARMGDWLKDTLASREAVKGEFEKLMDTPLAPRQAMTALQGLLWEELHHPEAFSTRARNTITGIHDLYANGKGNHGGSAYDLLNGFTEYYTAGPGAGNRDKLTPLELRANGSFGGAAEKKTEFAKLLCSVDKTGQTGLESLIEMGATGGEKAFLSTRNN